MRFQAMEAAKVGEIRIIGDLQHAHLLGSGIKTRHFRNGVELEPLEDDPDYDFNFQEMRLLKKERIVKPVCICTNSLQSPMAQLVEHSTWYRRITSSRLTPGGVTFLSSSKTPYQLFCTGSTRKTENRLDMTE